MTGLAALLLTSRSGAKFTCTPSARPSIAVIRPSSYASIVSRVAPNAICGGKIVAPPRSIALGRKYPPRARSPAPYSKSLLTSSGTDRHSLQRIQFDRDLFR